MTQILDLAPEILESIFLYCETSLVVQVCRSFAEHARAFPALWTSVRIGPHQVVPEAPFYLRYRLERAGSLPLNVFFTLHSEDIDNHALLDICSVLSLHKAQIRKFEIISQLNKYIGPILKDILFSPPEDGVEYPSLEELMLLFNEPSHRFKETDPGRLLGCAAELFPKLHTLHLTAYSYMIPLCVNNTPFSQLKTLILDGSDSFPAPMHSICALLHHTPNLETLWFKACDRYSYHNIHDHLLPPAPQFQDGIPVPVKLPHLLRLSLTAPGSATDFLHYVELPVLRELYLDGTRDGDATWGDDDAERLQRGLQAFSRRAPALRRIVFDSTYLSKSGWKWLFTGHELRPSFPQLHYLHLRDLNPDGRLAMSDGLDDEVFLTYAKEPRLPLRNISVSRSDLAIGNKAIVEVAKTLLSSQSEGGLQFNIGSSCAWFTSDLSEQLQSIGVAVSRSEGESQQPGWWTLGSNVNPLQGFINI